MIQRLLFYKDSNKTKYLNYEIKNESYMSINYYRTINQLYSKFDIWNYVECQKKPNEFKIAPSLIFYQNRHCTRLHYQYDMNPLRITKKISFQRFRGGDPKVHPLDTAVKGGTIKDSMKYEIDSRLQMLSSKLSIQRTESSY
jgi:hypothetical protein